MDERRLEGEGTTYSTLSNELALVVDPSRRIKGTRTRTPEALHTTHLPVAPTADLTRLDDGARGEDVVSNRLMSILGYRGVKLEQRVSPESRQRGGKCGTHAKTFVESGERLRHLLVVVVVDVESLVGLLAQSDDVLRV